MIKHILISEEKEKKIKELPNEKIKVLEKIKEEIYRGGHLHTNFLGIYNLHIQAYKKEGYEVGKYEENFKKEGSNLQEKN